MICKTKLTEYDEFYQSYHDNKSFVCMFCFGNLEYGFTLKKYRKIKAKKITPRFNSQQNQEYGDDLGKISSVLKSNQID